jgi:hypothetical protein
VHVTGVFGGLPASDAYELLVSLYLLSALLLSAALVFGQGTRTGSEYGSLASHDRLGSTKSGVGHPGTPAGSYTITVTVSVGSVSRSTQVMLTVQ